MQAPSLTAFLGELPSEDLARRADALREMVESDGWRFYQEMLEVQRVKLQRQAESAPLDSVQTYAHGMGVLYGLRQGGEIVGKALKAADRDRARIEKDDVGDGHD